MLLPHKEKPTRKGGELNNMARPTKKVTAKSTNKATSKGSSAQTVTRVERMDSNGGNEESLFEKLSASFQKNQSFFNVVLGGLIVVVLGVLLFNYFNRPDEDLAGPAQQTEMTETSEDVAKENLPGNYTVKQGDTLFTIAEKYYDDGFKYSELVKANSLENENAITEGQVLEIPKISDNNQVVAEVTPTPEASATPIPSMIAEATPNPSPIEGATGGAENATIWGEKITTGTYTVQAGDWLSKIAGRAYGDVMMYQKIAQANNITNPDSIEVGMTLTIPR